MTAAVHKPAPSFDELLPLPPPIADAVGAILHAPHWMGLALHLPLRFEDKASITAMDALQVGQKVNLLATVVGSEVQYHPRKQLRVWVEDGDTSLLLRWLHFYPGLQQKLSEGTRIQLSGQIRQGFGTFEMVHPTVKIAPAGAVLEPLETMDRAQARADAVLEPVYPSTGQLKQSDWHRWMKKLPPACFVDTLPPTLCKKYKLTPWPVALQTLHGQAKPQELYDLNLRTHPAWTRVKVDELLAQQLLMREYRQQRTQENASVLKPAKAGLVKKFIAQLPFKLTGAQERSSREIFNDLAQPYPMQRLLQGDVGSGKTLVAALACLRAIENGKQAAILAPTEVLAAQHHHKLTPLFEAVGVRCAKLQGAMKKSEKDQVLKALATGEVDVVIGTHALVQDHVEFKALALVVVDEQHRFGVAQRLSLIGKASKGHLAHQLMMSATPIPRTLAQTYLSDLAVSNLDEKPPGRKPIITKLLSQKKREQLIAAIEGEIEKGQQAYWVCPLIEESETLDLQAAQATYTDLCEQLPTRRIGLLHGKQDNKLKQATMSAFAAGELDLLVSTTVIEVGVDVGNASLMVIDQAERFGLAQLHQLRGRVGRGSVQSVCVLLFGGPLSNTSKMRLKAMHESDDGFYLAEKDLEIRGPGELLGKRQSGLPMMRYADPMIDKDLLELARTLAQQMPMDAENTRRHIQRWIEETPWWLS
ncbi:ATP-dependent DNA helicase RecG [Limnobacter parvus]|uniref:ATP-dependent DNA helicase RecG n=1 Tax=Limnobacter parvus TaxID=2939690 RepID=A0ABT1XN81_9BURK|nr:ATP-dependent DNA helicase RecG [Limnobacter parvus]MCR2747737.1 ATP-dependent DNA helicase RecG [Limnobacter parvus]